MTVEEAVRDVEEKLDEVGEELDPMDWLETCEQLMDNIKMRAEAAREEQEDGSC